MSQCLDRESIQLKHYKIPDTSVRTHSNFFNSVPSATCVACCTITRKNSGNKSSNSHVVAGVLEAECSGECLECLECLGVPGVAGSGCGVTGVWQGVAGSTCGVRCYIATLEPGPGDHGNLLAEGCIFCCFHSGPLFQRLLGVGSSPPLRLCPFCVND